MMTEAKKNPVTNPENRSMQDIFSEIFSVKKDKNDRVEAAKTNIKGGLNALINTKNDLLGSDFIDKLCVDVCKTDPQLSCLVRVLSKVMDCNDNERKEKLFKACLRIASGVWIGKDKGHIDLYEQEIFSNFDDSSAMIKHLENTLTEKFKTRLENKKKAIEKKYSDESIKNNENKKNDLDKELGDERAKLDQQKENLLLIGFFWLIHKNKIDADVILNDLISNLKNTNSKTSLQDANLYLIRQKLDPDKNLFKVLSFLRDNQKKLTDENQRLQDEIVRLKSDKAQLEKQINTQQEEMKRSRQENDTLQAQFKKLNDQIHDQEQDAKADRTHLRDNARTAKSKAFNLMSEDIQEPLKLASRALLRDHPKVDVALHQIELALDSIERELKWFSE